MALNVGKLDKFKAPAPAGADPMLDEAAIGEGLEEESPFAALSDEEFIEEAQKRGLDVKLPEAEAEAIADEELELDDEEMY